MLINMHWDLTQVLGTYVTASMMEFWAMMTFSNVGSNHHFGGTCCAHVETEVGDSGFIWKIYNHL